MEQNLESLINSLAMEIFILFDARKAVLIKYGRVGQTVPRARASNARVY
jgi:hypothetical protein